MSSWQAWKTAARPHTLPAAVVPVLVGSALAYGQGSFRLDAFVWAFIGALAIQVAANFANDASDAKRGADTPERLGPPRMVAQGVITPSQMWTATWTAIAVAGLAGIMLTLIAGWIVLVIGTASIVAMLGYVGGPVPYGYRGLGEVFVFVFFGLVATAGTRYVHDQTVPVEAWLLAVPIGLVASAILVANNYRDIATDRAAGKRTLSVIVGPDWSRRIFAGLIYGSFVAIALFATVGPLPSTCLFVGFLLPLAVIPVRIVYAKTDGPALIRALKATSRLHLWMGLILAAAVAFTL